MADTRPLQTAREAESWIRGLEVAVDGGCAWSRTPSKPDTVSYALYDGSSGIIVFYLELYAATGEAQFLETAIAAAGALSVHVRSVERQSCAIYTGWPGQAFALGEVARVSGEARFVDDAHHCLDRLRANATEFDDGPSGGIGWIEPMPFSEMHGFTGDREIYDASVGAAGAGFELLDAAAKGLHPDALDWATAVGDRLLAVADRTEGGLNWALMSEMPFSWTPSNFAHGAAGVGTYLAMLFEATGETRFLDAARAAAHHLMHIATPAGDGHLVRHHDEDSGPSLFYLSACHGPPGTVRLFEVLNRIEPADRYTGWMDGALSGLLSTGAPEQRSDGLWNNYGQCCGDAGIGDYALHHYRLTGGERYLELATRVADELQRRGEHDAEGRHWLHAEHRQRPDFQQSQTGYMQGAAGIGSFFVHLATTLDGQPVKIAFPDTPYESIG